MQTAQIEQIVIKVIESRLKETFEDFVRQHEFRAKEMSLLERIIRVEEVLKAQSERFEKGFQALEKNQEALLREMNARFEAVYNRFESMDKRFEARFEAMDKRFESLQREIDARFESQQREMNARFEAMDKRFTMIQWLIGILVGIPSLAFTITQLVKIL